MKVLLNAPEPENPGGVAYYYRCVRPHLPADVEYFVIGARARDAGSLRNWLRMFRDYGDFIAKLRAKKYDVVHLNPSFVPKAIVRDALFLLIAKAFRTKVIVFWRGWNESFARVVGKYLRRLFRLIYSKADAFIVLSSDFEARLAEMGIRKPIFRETTVVADEVIARIDVRSVMAKRKERGGDFHILFLSRIEESKGIYIALDTLRLLRERNLPVMMTVAGDGGEAARAQRYAERNRIEAVEFPGYLNGDAKHMAFSRADMYFFPTCHGEGMPNSLLEAMAYGLPVVARSVGGIRDLLVDGKMGFLTESLSCAVFADLIEALIKDSAMRDKMGGDNHRFVVERCMASSVAKRLQSVYSTVLSGNISSIGSVN
jgi:glycosyltransferase involved in cell wall biosynthesis